MVVRIYLSNKSSLTLHYSLGSPFLLDHVQKHLWNVFVEQSATVPVQSQSFSALMFHLNLQDPIRFRFERLDSVVAIDTETEGRRLTRPVWNQRTVQISILSLERKLRANENKGRSKRTDGKRKLTWKNLVWKRVNEQPILRSSSCLASTDLDSFSFGSPSFVMAALMSLSVIALNFALNMILKWIQKCN